jgi:hypothetical protein
VTVIAAAIAAAIAARIISVVVVGVAMCGLLPGVVLTRVRQSQGLLPLSHGAESGGESGGDAASWVEK